MSVAAAFVALGLMFLGDTPAAADASASSAPFPGPSLEARHGDLLQRRGRGVFRYMGMKLYEAELYASEQAHTPQDVLRSPKRLVIRYFRDIPKKALIQAAERNLANRSLLDDPGLRQRVDRLHGAYTDLKKGDEYVLADDGSKTTLYYRGRPQIEIEGRDFAEAYFGIWLSGDPISQKLRKKLLARGDRKS